MENFQEGLLLSAVGLGIVFGVLTAIAGCVLVMRRLDDAWQVREARDNEAAFDREPTIDTTTLVVIAAAVTTLFEGRGRIQRIWRLPPSESPTSAWAQQGRSTLQGSHMFTRKR